MRQPKTRCEVRVYEKGGQDTFNIEPIIVRTHSSATGFVIIGEGLDSLTVSTRELITAIQRCSA